MQLITQFFSKTVRLLTGRGDNSKSSALVNALSNDASWDETAREELRETLRRVILGEVRLANIGHEDIVQICREAYIEEECPEDELEEFVQFATAELDTAVREHSAEQEKWLTETDCDRLDHVESALRERGILLWQVSPCCDTCTGSELPDRIEEIDRRHPGFRHRVRGYAFFIDQNMADMLAEDTQISVYLAYGWFAPEASEVAPDEYQESALAIAHEICACLRDHGLEPDWNGDFAKKIGLSLNWQRRTMLE